MELTPEERQRIYEEEKARMEAESKARRGSSDTTGLPYNVASLLCYLGMWVTGIIFLVLEQKDERVRFHAAQSIVTFGTLLVLSTLLRFIPVVGWLFATAGGTAMFIIWIVLMVKTYRGEIYRLPIASDLADLLLKTISGAAVKNTHAEAVVQELSQVEPFKSPNSRAGHILESVFAIIFSLVMLIIINVFYDYIAYYSRLDGAWIRQSLVTGEWRTWLPVANVVIVLSIIGHVVLILDGRRLVRESIRIVIDILSIIAIGTLLFIFPFNFYPLPLSETLATFIVQMSMGVSMAVIAIVIIVRFVRLIISMLRT